MLSTIKDNLDRIVDKFRLVEKYGDDGAKKIISLKDDVTFFVDDSGWSLRVFL